MQTAMIISEIVTGDKDKAYLSFRNIKGLHIIWA